MEPLIKNEPIKIDNFETAIKEYGKSIFHYIFKLVKHKELAEDLYQEVLISAYIAFPSFEEYEKVKSWLYKIAINKCRDYWRKEKKAKKFWEESVYMYARDTSVSMPPEEEMMEKCAKEEMMDTLDELPKMYSEPLMLFYYHHQTLIEISNKTKTPLSTVKTRMKRAKDKLKPKMASKLVYM
ncbi:RNA polymerase sigma factor [Niallia sp. 01092]|uniref:RNA polymerase sigma factor n=1 Tax=unclassified Niallia TaxID=2837522 RepID=UPI003FD0B25B